jgi:[acyl-carrier-protein] S-malonyltransferase
MKAISLTVAGAFHTPIMQPAVTRLAAILQNVPLHTPSIPVISNVDAMPHEEPEEIRRILVEQVVKPVLWENSMRWLLGHGVDQVFEIGPGRVLRGLMKRIDRKLECIGVME